MSSSSINELLESLKVEYLAGLPERLAEIETLILKLPDNSDAENLLRIVHSLKGSAGTHGFHIFTKICHQMEDMMRELIESGEIFSESGVVVLLKYNDVQQAALKIINSNENTFSEIDDKLNQIKNTVGSQACKVLIVEPSPLYAAMIETVLKAENCQTKIVTDGLVALENLLMQSYDVVITALEVPTLNGDALISALRISNGKNKNINAILITTKDLNNVEHSNIFNHVVNRNVVKDSLLPSLIV